MMNGQEMNLPPALIGNYLYTLVNRFYKILPMKESGEPTLTKYISSLRREMIGCLDLIEGLEWDGRYMTLLATLSYLETHMDEADNAAVKTEVFRAIGTIKQLRRSYGTGA